MHSISDAKLNEGDKVQMTQKHPSQLPVLDISPFRYFSQKEIYHDDVGG